MNKNKKRTWWKRILVSVLSIALVLEMIPSSGYTTKVEAATYTIPNYSLYITGSKPGEGQIELSMTSSYDYTGLSDVTSLVVQESNGGSAIPVVTDVPDATSIAYTWEVDMDNKVISIDNTTLNKANIRRVGPGAARVTCNISWMNASNVVIASRNITSTLRIPADIDKSTTTTTDMAGRPRSPFTKLNTADNTNNTALMFYKDDADIAISDLGKQVTLDYGTKSTINSVKWEPANTDIVDIIHSGDVNNETITVKPKRAGTTMITASSIKAPDIKDTFYAVVMPTFTFGTDVAKKTVPSTNDVSPSLSTLKPAIVNGGEKIATNALHTSDLKWRVTLFNDQATETNMLQIEKKDSQDAYIMPNPKAGAYRITAQAVVPGITTDTNLGVAQMYARVPITFPNGQNVVLGLYDSYDFMDNSNIQNINDVEIAALDAQSTQLLNIKNGVITGKDTGLANVSFKIKPEAAAKYGLYDDPAVTNDDYDKYVTNGVQFTYSIVDSFGINNSDITLALKGTADLTVSTESVSGISWTSSDSTVAEISNTSGKTATITALKVGTAIITVTQEIKGVKKIATCKVTVVKSAESIAIAPATVDMNVDDTKMLVAKLTPDNMLVGTLKWSSSDDKIVTIDSYNGLNATIKGTGDGTAIVTVINTDNAIIATCKVTVHGKATGITITPATATVNLSDRTVQLTAVVQPATNIQPELTWMSSDTDIADVDSKGLVSLKKGGIVKITAFVKNNPLIKGSATLTITKPVEGLKLEAASKVMYVGEKYKLGYTITPADAANLKVNWTSTKPSVAMIDSTGTITGIAVGDTTIIAQTADGRYTEYCNISIKQIAKNIKITTKDVTINKGDEYSILYTVDPTTSTDISVKWESLNPGIATVSATGKVKAVEIGSTTILARTSGGEIAYCNVTVISKASGLKLNYEEKTVYRNGTFTLTASILPEGATNHKVTYVSSKPAVATVAENGVVKGLQVGTTLITVTSDDGGYKATCIVTVKEMITKVTLNHSFYAVGIRKTFKLVPKVTATFASNKRVSYSSSDSSVAYVNSKGEVTGRKLGYAVITVRALDGSGAKDTCKVRVVRSTSSLKLNRYVMNMVVGRSTKLVATISPRNATYRTVKWTSSDPNTARVLSDGTITALKSGMVMVTASSKDSGGAKTATCYITIKESVSANSVTITSKNLIMVVGERPVTMTAALAPFNSTDYIKWESDNRQVASINSSTGTVTARMPGNATITAVSASGKMDSTTITVIGLDRTSLTLEEYDTYQLTVVGSPTGVVWISQNPNVATVVGGKVTALKAGTTRIEAIVRGKHVYCTLKVTAMTKY